MSISGTSFTPPIRFYEIRHEKSFDDVAAKFDISCETIIKENPGAKCEPGEMLVLPRDGNTFRVS
ncbi:MAG: hypothetical protein WCV91_01810 [Candidatus Margulisiibacteriota bacterium]